MRKIMILLAIVCPLLTIAQDTTIVQTLTYDSTGRDYVFQFPEDDGTSYEKILMQYSMRCKDGLVTTQGAPNDHGCGEWDYSCNTFIEDSSKTDSIKATHPSHIILGFSGNTYSYTTTPTYSYKRYLQFHTSYSDTISETMGSIGQGSESLNHPFGTVAKVSKTQYLWKATELTAAGLSASEINGIKLNLLSVGTNPEFVRIRIKTSELSSLDPGHPELADFTEVYFKHTELIPGENHFKFYTPFNWDGSSNLIIEFSYTNPENGSDNLIEGHTTEETLALISNTEDRCLNFNGSGRVDIHNSDYSSVSEQITVSFWAFGNEDKIPSNTYIFEGKDANNNRQVNCHLPWSNSRVYWDCGYDGGYDRIDKAASSNQLEGRWNHWAFTKNTASGNMAIYLNGELWHSGSGKDNPIEIESFFFGAGANGSTAYFGHIDDFAVWDVALSQEEISHWMYHEIDDSHPQYEHLINYFGLNQEFSNTIIDNSENQAHAIHEGIALWHSIRGNDLFKNFSATAFRPNVTFVQGEYVQINDTISIIDSVVNPQNLMYTYAVAGSDLTGLDTSFYYQAGNMYVYDALSEEIVDTVYFEPENTIEIGTLEYYNKYPGIFELMSFVTPYGIYLDLGMEGKTWQFEVSDLEPVLHGAKRIFLTGGIYQEDLDIRFLFIKGTPAREVIDIQQIWRAGTSRSYAQINADTYFEPRNVFLNPEAHAFKIRSAITGHGQEGEFIPRMHHISLNNDEKIFTWQVWKECGDNPIYPQGGTWVYDRAGWCPGAATDMEEMDITDWATPGEMLEIDYGMASATGDSRYIVSHQLVSYGEANFDINAAIVDIQRPSKRIEFGRVNPVCYNPTITIRNDGATELSLMLIEYSVSGGSSKIHEWRGSLKMGESEEVVLPLPSADFWFGDDQQIFTATLSYPNDQEDEYPQNNSMSSVFELPDMYDKPLVIYLKTNERAYENYYAVKDYEGNIVFESDDLENNTVYRDTLDLIPGCYTIELYDTGSDGLEWWANSAQGSGIFRLFDAESGSLIKAFETDFGMELRYSFVMDDLSYVKNNGFDNNEISIYPNPSYGKLQLDCNYLNTQDIKINIYDICGFSVLKESYSGITSKKIQINLEDQPEGVYFIKIQSASKQITKKIILEK